MKAVLLLLLLLPSAARASVPSPYASPELVQVILTRGDTLQARCVEPAPFDMVRITAPDAGIRYVSPVRIRAVIDAQGEDRTNAVLSRGETVGTPIPKEVRKPAPPKQLKVGPRSVTKSFAITETSLLGQVMPGGLDRNDLGNYFGFDLGWMRNVSDRTAVGWSGFIGSGNSYVSCGGRLRIRRWLSKTSSIEIAPGIIAAEGRVHGDALSPGYSLQAGWSPSRYLTLTTEIFTVRRRQYRYVWYYAVDPSEVRETGVMVGVKVGQWPGAVGGVVAALWVLLQAGLQTGSQDALLVP
jgi:hypothetical protein